MIAAGTLTPLLQERPSPADGQYHCQLLDFTSLQIQKMALLLPVQHLRILSDPLLDLFLLHINTTEQPLHSLMTFLLFKGLSSLPLARSAQASV